MKKVLFLTILSLLFYSYGQEARIECSKVIAYGIEKDALTRIPITEENITRFCSWKIEIDDFSDSDFVDFVFKLNENAANADGVVRLRVDFYFDDKIVSSRSFGSGKEYNEIFTKLKEME